MNRLHTKRLTIVTLALIVTLSAAAFAQNTPVLEGQVIHTVREGESIELIAAFYDVSASCLTDLNGLFPTDTLNPGDTLLVSDICPRYDGELPVTNPRGASAVTQEVPIPLETTPMPAPTQEIAVTGEASAVQTYTVVRGDSLNLIARRLNISAEAIRLVNLLPPGARLTPGMELIIPLGAPAYGLYPALENVAQGAGATYIIQPGDALDLIAAYFNIDLACLAERSGISNPQRIFPGQSLLLPLDCPPYSGISTPRPSQIHGLNLVPSTDPVLNEAQLIPPTPSAAPLLPQSEATQLPAAAG